MKRFLLACGENYYPCAGAQDWIDFFTTYDEALSFVKNIVMDYDWFVIIDIEDFENSEVIGRRSEKWAEIFNENG